MLGSSPQSTPSCDLGPHWRAGGSGCGLGRGSRGVPRALHPEPSPAQADPDRRELPGLGPHTPAPAPATSGSPPPPSLAGRGHPSPPVHTHPGLPGRPAHRSRACPTASAERLLQRRPSSPPASCVPAPPGSPAAPRLAPAIAPPPPPSFPAPPLPLPGAAFKRGGAAASAALDGHGLRLGGGDWRARRPGATCWGWSPAQPSWQRQQRPLG